MTSKAPTTPRDHLGHFVPTDCPRCGCGVLRFDGDGHWRCDGLDDPGTTDQELIACEFGHVDGEEYLP